MRIEAKNNNILRVRGSYWDGKLRQLLVTIPKNSGIIEGDFVEVRKKEFI